jgi:hypothetical protein
MTTRSSSATDQKVLKWCGMTGGVIELPTKATPRIPLRYPWSITEGKTALVAAASQDVGLQPDTNAPVAKNRDQPAPPRSDGQNVELQEMGAKPKVRDDESTAVGEDGNGRQQSTPNDDEKRLSDHDNPLYEQWRRELQQREEREDNKQALQRPDTDNGNRVHGKEEERDLASAQFTKDE